MSKLPKLGNVAFFGVLAIVGLYILRSFIVTTAPVPPMFSEGLTLEQAIDRSAERDGVVLAVVTADWCAPCQSYKKKGLADERVTAWINEHGAPASIDFDADRELAERFGITSLPSTLFFHNGEYVGGVSGPMNGDNLLAFLNQGLQQAQQTRAGADSAG